MPLCRSSIINFYITYNYLAHVLLVSILAILTQSRGLFLIIAQILRGVRSIILLLILTS